MIKSQLVSRIAAANHGLTLRQAEKIVDAVLDAIATGLADGRRVELRGFGAFSTRARDGRVGRNPRTGAVVPVSAKRVPYFKAGKEMRQRLNLAPTAKELVETD